MLPGLVTPTHLLLLLVAAAVFFGLRKLKSVRSRPAGSAQRRRLPDVRSLRLRRPTRSQAHVLLLIVCAFLAFALTRAVALPLFLAVFFVLWVCGYGVLARLYR